MSEPEPIRASYHQAAHSTMRFVLGAQASVSIRLSPGTSRPGGHCPPTVTDPDDHDDYRPDSRLALVFDPGDESGRAAGGREPCPPGRSRSAARARSHLLEDLGRRRGASEAGTNDIDAGSFRLLGLPTRRLRSVGLEELGTPDTPRS